MVGGSTSKNRLIALISERFAGNLNLAGSIYWMAVNNHLDVLYLVMVENSADELSIARRMATMHAYTSDEVVHAEYKMTTLSGFLKTFENYFQKGDVIIPPLFLEDDSLFHEMSAIWQKILAAHTASVIELPAFPELKKNQFRYSTWKDHQ